MNTTTIYRGIVTYYSTERHFGFLDTENEESIFFFVDTRKARELRKEKNQYVRTNFIRGDEVTFKLKHSDRSEYGFEAYDLDYIKNDKVEQLYNQLEVNKEFPGYLKKIGDEYFVKDKLTYLFIPVKTSVWEADVEQVYESRINRPVIYTITAKPAKPEKLKAVLCDRIYSDVLYQLKDYKEKSIRSAAMITGKNKDGYFATMLDGKVNTFIPFNKEGTVPLNFSKGDEVEVIVTSVYDQGVRIQLA